MCTVDLMFVDLDTGESITLGDTDLTVEGNNVTFTTELLTTNRRFNVTANATNIAGSSVSHTTMSEFLLRHMDIPSTVCC